VERLAEIAETLIAHGRAPETPAAVIQEGTTAAQRSVTATLATVAQVAADRRLSHPAIVVIGEVVAVAERLASLAAQFGTAPKAGPG